MSTKESREREALLQGTLDLLVLRILSLGPHHGHGIVRAIETQSGNTLLVDHGSLYPALQRLEQQRLVRAEWGTSEANRRARYYAITTKGRARLRADALRWRRLSGAMIRVLGPALAED